MLSKKKQDLKGHILYDSIYMKYPEWTNPQRQKANWWLPGVGGQKRSNCLKVQSFLLS